MHSILLAEDNPDVRFMVSEILRTNIDCVVLAARDGLETVHLTQEKRPDLVLLDIRMPGMDGFEVCRILKSDSETRHIPIIFLTATYDDLRSKIRGMELGADDYIIQPVDNLELVTRVKVMLRIRALYEELLQAGQRLQAAERKKFIFLSHISHELRGPLGGVLGAAELLAKEYYGPLNSNQREFLSLIEKGGRQLLMLVDDISLLAKLETGSITLHPAPLFLPRLIDKVWLDIQNMAYNKGISFQQETDPEAERVIADKEGLETVLRNLLDNAIRFNRVGGQISVRCRLQPTREPEGRLVALAITDTGPGISPEDKNKIFTPFPRIARRTGAEPGSGLGLAICKKFVRSMGGRLEFESKTDAGSTFTVYLPFPEETPTSSTSC